MMKWRAIAAVLAVIGGISTTQASEMEKSFSAVETGNFNNAVAIWADLAEQGDPQAQFNLGLMYHGGLGLPRSEPQAVALYKKAAEAGYQPAQVYLVVGYEEGWFGLPQDSNKAYYWRGVLGSDQ